MPPSLLSSVTLNVSPGMLPNSVLASLGTWYSTTDWNSSNAFAGLGLTMVKRTLESHGGRVWVERPAGGGAAFRFTLPVEDAPAPPAEG